jgi:alkanesulfonate monooxygenase SsuD/methylene tetrahydromethanopterin reductase-like flavin-dependent oxidoreductase (luciferase family)
MKYGIGVVPAGEVDIHALVELAQLAEQAGWDGFFIEDYITHWLAPDAPTLDPWISLSAIALLTKTMRIGTLVSPLSRRRPWKVAREAATVDHLSNGRLILGVGLGGTKDPMNFDRFGEVVDLKQRAQMLDEALDIITGVWSGEWFSYPGKHFRVENVRLLPTPVQKPRIPIWVGGGYPNKGPLQRAARWDGSCMYRESHGQGWLDMQPGDVREMKVFIEKNRGTTIPYDICVGGRARLPDWELDRDHIRAVADAGATWWMEFIEPTSLEKTRRGVLTGPLK